MGVLKPVISTILALAGFAIITTELQAFASSGIGESHVAISARTTDGARFRSDDPAGNVIIVNFWATWCGPCRREMPALESYYREHRDEGLRILAISLDDPEDSQKVNEFMSNFTYPAAFYGDAELEGFERFHSVPATYVIDRQGRLINRGRPKTDGIDAEYLESAVTPLLRSDGE